jgi:hypothetical protein
MGGQLNGFQVSPTPLYHYVRIYLFIFFFEKRYVRILSRINYVSMCLYLTLKQMIGIQ